MTEYPVSENLREVCKARLLACASEVSSEKTPHKGSTSLNDGVTGTDTSERNTTTPGGSWVLRTISTVTAFDADKKHFKIHTAVHGGEFAALKGKAMEHIELLGKVRIFCPDVG